MNAIIRRPLVQAVTTRRSLLASGIAIALLASTSDAPAAEMPSGIRAAPGELCWDSAAPSVNVYENGVYKATVHDAFCYTDIRDGAVYRLAAHDRGRDFSAMSPGVIGRAAAAAGRGGDDDDDDEIEWAEARLYFELNDTDGDLGLHMLVDGEGWDTLEVSDANERRILRMQVSGALREQGMTELFFESDEPTFDELPPAEFFARFPEGEYEIEARTLDGREQEGEIELSHVIPDAPRNVAVGGIALPGDCDDGSGPTVDGALVVAWSAVTGSHPTLGRFGAIELEAYQIAIEREEPPLHLTIDIDPSFTSVSLPRALFAAGDEVKVEVLAIADTSSRSATESCFIVGI